MVMEEEEGETLKTSENSSPSIKIYTKFTFKNVKKKKSIQNIIVPVTSEMIKHEYTHPLPTQNKK